MGEEPRRALPEEHKGVGSLGWPEGFKAGVSPSSNEGGRSDSMKSISSHINPYKS